MRSDLGRRYEILWNGENDGADGDLLDVTLRVPIKRYPGPAPTPTPQPKRAPTSSMHLVLLEVLPPRKEDAIDCLEIRARSRFSQGQLTHAPYILRKKRLVGSEVLPEFRSRKCRAPQSYWRIDG